MTLRRVLFEPTTPTTPSSTELRDISFFFFPLFFFLRDDPSPHSSFLLTPLSVLFLIYVPDPNKILFYVCKVP